MSKKYFTYLARCSDHSLYTGMTDDLDAREKKHNAGKGSKYTRSRLPIKIIYSESFDSRSDAAKREAEIKRWPKIKKEHLVRPGGFSLS